MIQDASLYELTSAIRFTPTHDCIGIPLFCLKPENTLFLAETDDSLIIQAFHPFTDDDANVERVWEVGDGSRYFQVGDPIPVPVWAGGKQEIISASSSWENIRHIFADTEGVAARLKATLERGRSKAVLLRQKEITDISDGDFFDRYGSIFEEHLAADRNWVSTFRQALREAHEQPLFRDFKVVDSLEALAKKWAAQYANKAETKVVHQFIDALQHFGGDGLDMKLAVALALLRHIVAKPSSARTLGKEIEKFSLQNSRVGLIDYLSEQFMEDAVKKWFDDACRDLTQSVTLSLVRGKRSEIDNYTKIFGVTSKLPFEAKELAEQITSIKKQELHILAERVLNTHLHNYSFHLRQSFAFEAIETARLIEAIQKLLNPELRGRAEVWDYVGIADDVFNDIQQVAKDRAL